MIVPKQQIPPPEMSNEDAARHDIENIASDVSAFSSRKFGAGQRTAALSSTFLAKLKQPIRLGIDIWRRHLQQDQLPKMTRLDRANIARALFALLSVLVIISCIGTVAALMQLKSLRSELTAMQSEVNPMKEMMARLDQIDRKMETKDRASDRQSSSPPEKRFENTPLSLSREEIQLIRDYIKPAPVAGPSAAPIRVGDPVNWPTIPFPSAITEKVPKLLGARFAIKNTAIIVVNKDSRHDRPPRSGPYGMLV